MTRRLHAIILLATLLEARPAAAEIVVVINPSNRAAPMDRDHVALFFLGKSNALTPVEQGKNSTIRRDFYQKLAGRSLAQMESVWAKLEFTGRGTAPRTYASDAAVKKAVAANELAIGYIDRASADNTVKVILVLP